MNALVRWGSPAALAAAVLLAAATTGAALDRWESLGGDGARLELAAERREIEIGAVAEPSA